MVGDRIEASRERGCRRMGVRLPAITRTESPIQALSNRSFRLLWLGQGTSWLGDQFRWIALPWLVLQLTHDPLALGAVLALGGIPEAALALIGGAIADRFPPRTIMLLCDLVRLVVLALLAVLTFTGMIDLWMLYASSFVLGAVSGLFSPASAAMIPLLVEEDGLRAANSVSQGTSQLMGLIGPALAGSTIAVLGRASTRGIALAFGFDALTFLASVSTLWFIAAPRVARAVAEAHLLESITAGLRYAWSDPVL
ncbi:MAG: MFS transporter, partial [Rudaea sp.]